MSLTKAQLQGLNTTNFPNNTTGYITPELLRNFNSQSIDSMALQTQVDSLSSSFQSQLNGLEAFTASLVTNFATVAQLNASSSTLQSNINGRATTGSVNTLSQSVYVGFDAQATINSNTTNRFNADELAFNSYTQSNNTALAGKASLSTDNYFVGNQYVTGKITATGTVTGSNITSFALDTASFNSFTSSQNFTNSTLVTTSSFNTFSGSQYKGDSSSFDSRINGLAVSGGVLVVQEEGSILGPATSMNFIGSGVTTTFSAGTASVTIPGGGGTIYTGSFATTGSNTFSGSQTIRSTNGTPLIVDHSDASSTQNTLIAILSSGSAVWSIGNQGTDESFILYNAQTFAIPISVAQNNGVTFTGNITASANISSSTISGLGNATLFSASISSRINSISGSGGTIYTGSFATTGSNSFLGTQTLLQTGSWGGVLLNVQSGSIKFNGQVAETGFSSTGSIFLSPVNLPHGSTKVVFQTEYQSGSTNPGGYNYLLGLGRQGDTFINTVDIGTDVTLDVSRANLVGFPYTTTSSFNSFTQSYYTDSSSFNSRILAITSSTINTASFATTGSNTFVGIQRFTDTFDTASYVSLSEWSGSLLFTGRGWSDSGPFSFITSSLANASGSVNIILKDSNTAAQLILSGSNNVVGNSLAATAGFYKFLGSGNLALQGATPQISGTMLFPITMNSNILPSVANTITLRGPASSSTWTVNSNIVQGTINVGQSAAINAEKIVNGLTIANNNVAGTLTLIANQAALTGSTTATQVIGNSIAGTVQLQLSSSNLAFTNNIVNGTAVIDNAFYSQSLVGVGRATVGNNNFAGGNQFITISGSLQGGVVPSYSNNVMFGNNNTLYCNVADAPVSNSLYQHSALNTMVLGVGLTVSGSSSPNQSDTIGSQFTGRYNAIDGNRAKTAQTILAVGTGTSITNRKTGLLVDSGSNTFVEGTFNVSGSTSFTGSLNVLSGSSSGSVITNVGDTFTGTAAVTKIISLSSAEYAGITPDANTLYIII
jgi:hypothetical protein